MYVGIDIGGTKVLVGIFDENGTLEHSQKFDTPAKFEDFIPRVADIIEHRDITSIGIAVPGSFDSQKGLAGKMAHVAWGDVSIAKSIQKKWNVPIKLQNDANLAGLSEAIHGAGGDYRHVLYVTISTGIGTGIIIDKQIHPALERSEGGHMPSVRLSDDSHKVGRFENITSGSAIHERYGKYGYEIDDSSIWDDIAHDIAFGLGGMINLLQPDAVVIGGGIGVHFNKYSESLIKHLESFRSPIYELPPVVQAKYPEEAVLYGCYFLARGA